MRSKVKKRKDGSIEIVMDSRDYEQDGYLEGIMSKVEQHVMNKETVRDLIRVEKDD